MRTHSAMASLSSLVALTTLSAFSLRVSAQVATYQFNHTLNADQAGVAPLTATNPINQNAFTTDTVLGTPRTVYQTFGTPLPPSAQAGLTLDSTGLLSANNTYSILMVTKTFDGDGAWRRLVDVQNRQSDNGFYVDPSNRLDVYPVGAGTTSYTTGAYHVVVLTDNAGTVNGYLDGNPEFSLSTTVMDINNPGNLINFYLDNVVGGGQGEYTDASTALIELYNSALSAGDVQTLSRNPFPAGPSVPEPGTLALLATSGLSGAGLLLRRRIRRS